MRWLDTLEPDGPDQSRRGLRRARRRLLGRHYLDLAVVPASVARVYGATFTGTLGSTATAGQPGYRDPTTGLLNPAKNDTAIHAAALGIFLNGGTVNQSATLQMNGQINLGVTGVVGANYHVSSNAGGIAPEADFATGHYATFLCTALPNNIFQLQPLATGQTHA